MEQRISLLTHRIEKNEKLVHLLQATANEYYSPMEKKSLKGWNTLLGSRDKIKKLISQDEKELLKLEKCKIL